MFGYTGIIFTQKHEKFLGFLSSFDSVTFGIVTQHIGDGSKSLNYMIGTFIVLIFFKNSTTYLNDFKSDILHLFINILLLLTIYSCFSNVSEFLYFNF